MTSKHEQLLTFYEQLLSSLDFVVDEQGRIDYMPSGAVDADGITPMRVAAMIDGKRWVLPTKAVLDRSPWGDSIAMHPLAENINNATTEVINTLQSAMNLRMNSVFGQVFLHMIDFAGTADKQNATIPARAAKYRQLLPHAKPITVKHATQILDKAESSNENRFVNLYLRRSAELDGVKYLRAGIVNFPFREDLEGKEPRAFGVTFSEKDRGTYKALFDFILPGNRDDETYSVGSSHSHAPSLDALLQAYYRVASRLNEVIHTHAKILPGYKELKFELDWYDSLPLMTKFADSVPPLPGNVGDVGRDSRPDPTLPVSKAAARAATAVSKFQKPAPERTIPMEKALVEVQTDKRALAQDDRRDTRSDIHSDPTATERTGMTFAERLAAGRGGPVAGAYGQPMANAYGQPMRGAYGQPIEPPVPEWAAKGQTTITVAGDPNPPSHYDRANATTQNRYRPTEANGPSLADRLAAMRNRGGGGGGQQGGGGYGGGGGNFRL